jgi:ATP-binding cassette subfamily B multidrug efflux pump
LLSTGQKQLLALARVLVRARSILIFDEATANIDSHTEGLIQESITRIRGEKTIISIAHRLSTIRGADCIYIIENGEISERGTYEDLMSAKGVFYTLWTTQLRNA